MALSTKKRKTAKLKAAGCQTWLPPESAPLNGTLILGDFGWPWPIPAVWDTYDEQWCVATVQASPMQGGPHNYWLETDTEKKAALKRWMPLPQLPKEQHGVSPIPEPPIFPVREGDIAFGGDVTSLLPAWDEIPAAFKSDAHPFNQVVTQWFFGGLPAETEFQPKPGVDPNAAILHVAAIMRSFQPKHEHKNAGCAYLLSLWFEDIRF